MLTHNPQTWFETPLGQYLLAREQDYFDQAVADVFGFNALQVGLPQFDFLRANRISLKIVASREAGETVMLRAAPDFLPIETSSIDLILLPHVLEFSDNPHQILREVERVLMPEGHVIISGFNPRSLWGAKRNWTEDEASYPWCGNFIALPRLKDWMKLLDFEVTAGRLCCYVPPFAQEKWLQRFAFMEAAGDRWWPISGGVYFLAAVKRVYGMRVIKPDWKDVLAAKNSLAPISQKLKGSREPSVTARQSKPTGDS